MDRRIEKEDEYWTGSAQKGFDFGDDPWPAKPSQFKLTSEGKRNEGAKQFDILQYDGLKEVVEKESRPATLATPESSSSKYQFLQTNKCFEALSMKHNPLELNIKRTDQPIKRTPAQTVTNMILGLEYSLEHFKGKDEKLNLLDAAVKSHDGNAIIAAVLFLRKTLKKSIFQHEIVKFPAAVNMYLSYLEDDHELDELTNMLLLLGRAEEAAMLKYHTSIAVENTENKIRWLENCLRTHFQADSVGNFLASSVSQHYLNINLQTKLLKFHQEQNPVESEDQKNLFEEITGKYFSIDTSVINTVLFSCIYYYHLPEANQFSPLSLKKVYNLNSNQYMWTAVRALVPCKKWQEIENMLHSKSWLGGKKMKCCIGFTNLLTVLSKHNAPVEVLERYVPYAEDDEQRLILAKKYNCHNLVIKILKTARDRQSLMQYVATLMPQSLEYCNANEALNSVNIKWKN